MSIEQVAEQEEYIGLLETEQGDCLHIVQRDNLLVAGSACNVGILDHYTHELDDCFSLHENLQQFIEDIEEKENT